jgi:hypothetical protein
MDLKTPQFFGYLIIILANWGIAEMLPLGSDNLARV